jgi:hypothetical protein
MKNNFLHDMVYDPPVCKLLPEYFDDLEEVCPSLEDFKKIPVLVNEYKSHHEMTPGTPKMFEPTHMIFD